jgi:hypothetical protein
MGVREDLRYYTHSHPVDLSGSQQYLLALLLRPRIGGRAVLTLQHPWEVFSTTDDRKSTRTRNNQEGVVQRLTTYYKARGPIFI